MCEIVELAKNCNSDEEFTKFKENCDDSNAIYDNYTLLYYVCRYNHSDYSPKLVKFLIENGADVNRVDKENGSSALMFALQFNTNKSILEITDLFIEAKVNVNYSNFAKYTAIFYALVDGYCIRKNCEYTCEVIEKLLIAGANPNTEILFANEYRMVIYYCSNIETCKLLIEYGAKTDARRHPTNIEKAHLLLKDEKIAKLEEKNKELEEKNKELLDIINYIPQGSEYANCEENYYQNLSLKYYEISEE